MAGTLDAGVLPETSNPDLLSSSSLDMEPAPSGQEPMDLDVPLDTPKMNSEYQEEEGASTAEMEVDEPPPPLLSKMNNTQSAGDLGESKPDSSTRDISAPPSITQDLPRASSPAEEPSGRSPLSSQSSASTPSKHLPDNARGTPEPALRRPPSTSTDKTDPEKCGECSNDFNDLQSYMTHNCSGSSSGTKPEEEAEGREAQPSSVAAAATQRLNDQEEQEQVLSDAESFDGKIVYNPDGSAYIIEGESELSETDSMLDVPHQEGSIVDHKGKVVSSTVASFPQIANAFYIQRNSQAFYNSFYMFPPENRPRPEAPIMHSFRVYDLRTKKGKENGCDDNEDKENASKKESKLESLSSDISTVPTKPILMCFICKLSFGYAKSFVAHAIGEHGMSLLEEERSLMSRKNASAIIQGLGKEKDPLLSFLEPSQPPQSGTGSRSSASTSLPQQGIFPPAMFNNNVSSSGSTSVSYVHSNSKVSTVPEPSATSQERSSRGETREARPLGRGPSNGSPEGTEGTGSDPLSAHHILPQGANLSTGANGKAESDYKGSHALSSSRADSEADSIDDDSSSRASGPSYNRQRSMEGPGGDKSPRTSTSPGGLFNSVPSSSPGSVEGRGGTPGSGADNGKASMMNTSGSSSGSGGMGGRLLTPSESHPPTDAQSPASGGPSSSNPSLTLSPPTQQQHVQGIVIRAGCEDHPQGNITGVECPKCDMIVGSSRSLGGHMTMMHSRNSCKTLKCPKCNWHYKYQETLEIHMKEKHPENETQCIYCITNQAHPRLARGEVYTCGYKPYRCEVCNYSTTTKGNLSIHMQSDKHINNMQELQNGTQEIKISPTQPINQQQVAVAAAAAADNNAMKNKNKPKPTWRCDVCNYETNVARNLRIHMTSEKHTHNMMVLQQNVKHMQRDMQFQLNQMAMLGQDPSQQLPGLIPPGLAPGMPPFFDQAMFMQMTPQGLGEAPVDLTKQENGIPGKSPLDVKNNNTEPTKLFQCAVCNLYSTDSLESLHQHMQRDRSKGNDQDNVTVVGGTYMCNLCQYKTNLKANFQLHCKTDKHLQRLQLVNHIREGGHSNEWRLKYMNVSNPVQVRCNACDYYTNSIHKLQLHTTNPRHEGNAKLFHHLQTSEAKVSSEAKYYHCSLCNYSTKAKLSLIQHVRSMKHMRNESLRLMQLKEQGKENEYTPENIFSVRELKENEVVNFDEGDGDSANESSKTPDGENSMEFKPDPGFREALMADSKHAMGGMSMGQQVHSCPFCNYTCVNPVQMQGHIQSQHAQLPTSGRALHCPLCQEKCGEKIQLEKHLFAVHNVTAEGMQRLLMLVDQPSWPSPPPATPTKSPAPSTSPAAATGTTTPSPRPASSSNIKEEEPSQDASDLQSEVLENQALKLAEEASMDGVELSDKDGGEEQYRCQTCAKTFINIDALYAHQNELGHLELKQTPRGPGYLCWKKGCNQYFKTAHTLQVHFREIHAKRQQVSVSERHVYKYRCNQCSLAFKTLDKLQLHSYYHIIRAATKCNVCGRNFRSIAAMRKHVESSHLDSMSPAELEEYQNSIASIATLGTLGVPGSENLTIAQLAEANREALNKESLYRPATSSAMEESKDTNEQSPAATVAKSEALASPEGTKDEQDSNLTAKDENSEDYKDQQFFEDYINSQAIAENSYSDPARKYKCHRCKVAFTKQSYLSAHNKTLMHRKGDKLSYPMEKYLDPNRPYKCDVCKESFTQKNILLVHYNSVSHLHKLKQLTQQQQQQQEGRQEMEAGQGSGQASPREGTVAVTSASSPSPTKVTSAPSAPGRPATPGSSASTSPDADKKPYKCNICKVSYSQGSTLDIHMRSVLHQTRASKLQELARTGQIDLSQPLIEQPDMGKSHDHHMKLMAEQMKLLSPERMPAVVDSSQSLGMPPPESPSIPLTPLQSQGLAPPAQSPVTSTTKSSQSRREGERSSAAPSSQSSQDALIQHQLVHCFMQPGATRGMPRFKPHVQKNLLENIGFECVMQFNEYHQRNIKKESQSEDKQGENNSEKQVSMEPVDVDIKKEKSDENEEDDEAEKENKAADMPEINKCQCKKCGKEFSSIWVLKAHQEEVHKEIVPFDYVEQFSEQFREQYDKKQQPPPAAETTVSAVTSEVPSSEPGVSEQYKAAPTSSASDDKTSNMPGDLAMDLALAQQTAQMMQIPMFNMMPMHLPGMPGMGQMGMMPPIMPMMMPPGLELCAGGMPGMPMMDPTFMLAQQQQQAAAVAAAQQQKRARTRINDEQLKILRLYFDINNSPSEEQILEMSEKSGLPPKVIKHWFRNTLFKERQRNKDSPYNFSVPPSTTLNLEEYEKTGKVSVDGGNGDEKSPETPVRKTPPTSTATPATPHKEEKEKSERDDLQDNLDRESVASIGDSFISSTCSTPAPHTPASLSGLTPGLAMAHQAAPAVNYNELSAALSSMVPTSLSPMVSHPPSMSSTPSSSMYSQPSSTTPPSSGHVPGKRANRTRFTDYQIKVLQEYFEQNAYPKDDDLEKLSKMLNLSPRVIVVWFQNARQKARKNYENQPPVDMSEDGNRFTRTPGLNYQCKKCFTVFQRYYELIKHQRTHCYKDDEKSVNLSSLAANSMHSSKTEDSSSSEETSRTQSHTPKETPHTSPKGSATEYPCEKCSLKFPSLELWKEHQNVHNMNPALFNPFPTGSAFGMLQNIAHQQQGAMSGGAQVHEERTTPKRRLEDEDVMEDQPRDKRMRTTILPEQLDYLYQKYQIDCNPSRKQLETIAAEIGLKKRVVQVWFQNTRARERKGQFRAHQQLIHKRCPFCRALFRAKSALESHLATKHPDEMAKGDVNIDSIPDESLDSMSSQPSKSPSPGNPGLDMAKLLNNPYNVPSPFGMGMMPPGLPGSSNSLQSNMNRLYEDSLKKYLDELSHASHPSKSSRPESSRTSSGGSAPSTAIKQEPDDGPLDLSKPIKVSTDMIGRLPDSANTDMSDRSEEIGLPRRFSIDDSRSETHSESTENNDEHSINESNPASPSSSMSVHSKQQLPSSGQGPTPPKRFRTQMTSLQIKVMKSLFADYKTPTMAECEMLGRSIGLPKRVVQVWFQNARAKEKKAKLNYGSSYGSDVEFSRPPEECKLCNFKYSHKYTVQDHVFTTKHIENVKAFIQSEKDGEQETIESSSLARHTEGAAGKGPTPGADPSMMSHPHLAQLHAMGLQAMAMPGPMAALNPSVKVSSTPGEKKEHTDRGATKVKEEPSDKKSSESKAKESPAPPSSSAAQMINPFGPMPMPGQIDMGLAAQAGMLPFLYPGMPGAGYMPGMPGMPMMHPGMMPGPEMFMYDPATFGTPLTLLQIPPQAIQDVSAKVSEEGCTLTRYTQDCRPPSELRSVLSAENFAAIREANIDVGYICKKCQMVYPGKEACVSHQQMYCYQGKDLSSAKSILKLEQTQYECTRCSSKLNTISELKSHCSGDRHKQKINQKRSADQ